MPADKATCVHCGSRIVSPATSCEVCAHAVTQLLGAGLESAASDEAGSGSTTFAKVRPVSLEPADRFEVIEEIGRGGMGVVYKVHDRALDEVVALKALAPLGGVSPMAAQSFRHEVKIARRLNHPNIVRLYDLCHFEGQLALTMEYIEGESLADVLKRGHMPLDRIRPLVRSICSALQAAHEAGIVHRDLKPANVIVDPEGRPRIMDFGVALLREGSTGKDRSMFTGTPSYMSPEQATSSSYVDHRADVYSLGVLLYAMLTGTVPFRSRVLSELIERICREAPRPPRETRPEIPAGIEQVVLRCLEKEPDARVPTAWRVFLEMENALGRQETEAPVPGTAARPRGKVLIVDDDPELRAFVLALLKQANVRGIEAADGAEGVDLAMREQPDLVLLDYIMPDLNGTETLSLLKESASTRHIPVVMLTGSRSAELSAEAKLVGADCFLSKPIQPDVLTLLVDKYVR